MTASCSSKCLWVMVLFSTPFISSFLKLTAKIDRGQPFHTFYHFPQNRWCLQDVSLLSLSTQSPYYKSLFFWFFKLNMLYCECLYSWCIRVQQIFHEIYSVVFFLHFIKILSLELEKQFS